MNISNYLFRIQYSGLLEPKMETLRALQRAHLYSVPFENLDIGSGRPIQLGQEALFDKVVRHRRGGFCYELNGLFGQLLAQLGFQVILLSASGAEDDGSYSMEFDHLCLEVTCPDVPEIPWLVDVGWGNGPLEPLNLLEGDSQRQEERVFKLQLEERGVVLLEQVEDVTGESVRWIKHYRLTRQPHRMEDFMPMCLYHQTSPDSIFTRKRMCTLFKPDGRVTLSDSRLITTRGKVREERELNGEDEVTGVLKEQFGIDFQAGIQ